MNSEILWDDPGDSQEYVDNKGVKFTKWDAMIGDLRYVTLTPHHDFAVVWHGCELHVAETSHDAARWMNNFIRTNE